VQSQGGESVHHIAAIYAVWCNFLRTHEMLRITRAMVAGLSEAVWNWANIVEAMDAETPAKKRGLYNKQADA
jgi:hypothetical protein